MIDISSEFYKPVVIESLIPEIFPAVALYMRSNSGNFTLYKPAERPLTMSDNQRLIKNGTKYLHVREGDFEDVCIYLEENLQNFLADPDLSRDVKNAILQQLCYQYVTQSMKAPYEIGSRMERCRSLIRNLSSFITSMTELQELLIGNTSAYLMAHSVQVSVLSMLMHDRLVSLRADELVEIGVGGMFHDIGYSFIAGDDSSFLETISEDDWQKTQLHPTVGHKFLASIEGIGPIALGIVKHHHERWDGTGYPDRLKGNNISRSVQIAAACDLYSTLTMSRTYRKASTQEEALDLLRSEVDRCFSATIYAALEDVVTGRK